MVNMNGGGVVQMSRLNLPKFNLVKWWWWFSFNKKQKMAVRCLDKTVWPVADRTHKKTQLRLMEVD